jgi:hypothetical protein
VVVGDESPVAAPAIAAPVAARAAIAPVASQSWVRRVLGIVLLPVVSRPVRDESKVGARPKRLV